MAKKFRIKESKQPTKSGMFVETKFVDKEYRVRDLVRQKARLLQRLEEINQLLAKAKELGLEIPEE